MEADGGINASQSKLARPELMYHGAAYRIFSIDAITFASESACFRSTSRVDLVCPAPIPISATTFEGQRRLAKKPFRSYKY